MLISAIVLPHFNRLLLRIVLPVLCYSCIEKAKKLDKFEYQLIALKKEMADILGCGPNDLDNVAEPTTEQTQGDHISATPKRINRPKRSKGAMEPAKKPRVSVIYCLF